MTESFGDRLRRLRIGGGLTQEALADLSGLSIDAISALESGRRRRPHRETVRMLADALGLDAAERDALAAAAVAAGRPRGAISTVAARELPRQARDFLGRDEELAALLPRATSPSPG